MQLTVFQLGDFNRGTAQFSPGLPHEILQENLVVLCEQVHGLVPVGRLQVLAQVRKFQERIRVQVEGEEQALLDRRGKRIGQATDAGTGPGFDQTQGTRHLHLLAQGRDADPQLLAQGMQGGQTLAISIGIVGICQVGQEF